ncbi:MAG: hypothetical protein WCF73_15600 [Candidatus Sulfotelmatobacter sp.]
MPKPRAPIIALWRWGASSQYRQPVVAPPPISEPILPSFGCGRLNVLAFYGYSEQKANMLNSYS